MENIDTYHTFMMSGIVNDAWECWHL